MQTPLFIRALALAIALYPLRAAADAPDGVVTFNELHYNPVGSQEGEWLELHNQMAVNIDLSRWSLADGIQFTFPAGTIIEGGGHLVVAKDPAHPSLAGIPGVLGPYSGNLSNSGETVDLLSPTMRLMDRITYGEDGNWPVAADGLGSTLAKKHPNTASEPPENWTASLLPGGTPGAVNHPTADGPVLHPSVGSNAVWRFHDGAGAPPPAWNGAVFDDSMWQEGQGPFGSGGQQGILTITGPLASRYEAHDISGVSNGETFALWPDNHTADGSAQDATSGGNPTYISSATPASGPAVRFGGNDRFHASISPGIPGNSGFAYFIVCRANGPQSNGGLSDGSGAYLFDRDPGSFDSPLASLKAVGGRYGFQKRHDNGSGIGGPLSDTPISSDDFQIVAIRRNPAASRFEIWVDGRLEDTTPDNGSPLTPQPLVIGRHGTGSNNGFNGDIAEVLVYREALDDMDFLAVGSYLQSRHGLETDFPEGVHTEIAATPTRYFRQTFSFSGDPSNSVLRLEHAVADGAVFHLNGQEIARTNLPEGTIDHETPALEDVPSPSSSGILQLPADALVPGTNVLSVSLHSSPSDTTGFFTAKLSVLESPPEPGQESGLQLNEIAAANGSSFFVEIRNAGNAPVNLAGHRIVRAGTLNQSFDLPSHSLAAGELQSFSEWELGFRPVSGDQIGLLAPGGAVLDARVSTNRLRGRSDAYPDRWIFPATPTPGSPNVFNLQHDVVINEICYHPPDLPAVPGTPPTTGSVPLLSYNSAWRYKSFGEPLGSGWAAESHPVGGTWQSGAGIHAFSTTSLPLPIGTALGNPMQNNPYLITYYFETDIELSAADAETLTHFQWNQLIDDGAVFYLNGTEIRRYNMPTGPVTSGTLAASGVATPSITGPFTVEIPPGLAVAGQNRLSVEVHQASVNSSDIVFGMELSAIVTVDPGTPDIPLRRSEEQWLELHNRGESSVNLSGWNFSEGITYTIPSGTHLPPGGYLIVSNDPSRHQGLPVVGPFSGNISRSGETLLLRDSFNNPANLISYKDGGRWPSDADGGGGTMELRDPRSDNNNPDSWAASDESSRHFWETHSYRGVASSSSVGPDNQWREFIFGLLNNGEILIDDIQVIEDPDGAAIPLIQGGDFESGPGAWRFLGNHRDANIVPDPENPSNNVLHLRATGATEHMHNHVEITLANNLSIVNGRTYEISFRTRWLRGSNLLNTRLYFNRLARTTMLDRPLALGTPGVANSTAVPNIGPVFTSLTHTPAVPLPGEDVIVTTRAADPDGIGELTLHYSVAGGDYESLPMATADGIIFTAAIPGQPAAAVVRFHVAATDAAEPPALSHIPAGGPASHALYQVNDGLAATNGLHNIRIIMDPADKAFLHQPNNVMSNGRIGCTVIYNEREVYYDVGVRLKSSQRGRQVASRVGFNLGFNKDQLFRGVLRTIAIDRSEGQITGCQEILYDHMMAVSGVVPAEYNDLVKVIAPDPAHTSTAILQLARFGNDYLDSQFENGSTGTVYEYELIYYPTTTDSNGYKLPQPDNVVGTAITDLGDDKENYRWSYLTKNNEDADDYSRIIAMAKHFTLSGTPFLQGIEDVIDVDQWLGALAVSCATGAGDSFFSNSRHNGQFYARPSDGRVLYFPHDMDFSFSATMPIYTNQELQKLVANPVYKRAYLGYLHHICTTVFNQSGMAPWTAHYGGLLPGENFPGHLSYINNRSNYILNAVHNELAPVTFAITTNGGQDFTTSESPVTLSGQGWMDVREIRLAGSEVPLDVVWNSISSWQVLIPLGAGPNPIFLEAWNHAGQLVGSDSIVVTNSGSTWIPSADNLVISEIHYHPGASQLTEFIEFLNISPSITLDLSGISFTSGITFTFPNGTLLSPGERIVLAKDLAAFTATYGSGIRVVGGYPNNLDNAGENLTLRNADGAIIRSFAYSDQPPWPVAADGNGWSLTLIDPFSNPNPANPANWRASSIPGGSPGYDDTLSYEDWKAANGNHDDEDDIDGDGFNTRLEYHMGGNPNLREPHLAPVFTIMPDGGLSISVHRSASATGAVIPEFSTDLHQWEAAGTQALTSQIRSQNNPAIDRLTFRIPPPAEGARLFVRFAFSP